ncbi:MAG: hypothetical protein AAFR93_13545 [Pseudomonadota bacterium]
MIWADGLIVLGVVASVAALAVNRAEVLRPDPLGSPFPKRLNEMLVNVLAGLALVMIATLGVYLRGVVLPLGVAVLAWIGYRRALTLDLTTAYRFKFWLAGAGLAAAMIFWLGAL